MLRRVLIVLALGVSVATADVASSVEDSQVDQQDIPGVIPGLDDIVKKGAEAAKAVGDAATAVAGGAVNKAAERLASAMKSVAQGITLLFDKMDAKAVTMLAEVLKNKDALLKAATKAPDQDEESLEKIFTTELQTYFNAAAKMSESVMIAAADVDQGIRQALEMADQTELAGKVHVSMKAAFDKMDQFRTSMVQARATDWPNVARAELRPKLVILNKDIEEALLSALEFEGLFMTSVKSLTDGINEYAAKLLPEAYTAQVTGAFNDVESKAAEAVDKTIQAAKAAVEGEKAAAVLFMPVPEEARSAGARLSLSLVAATVCAIFARL